MYIVPNVLYDSLWSSHDISELYQLKLHAVFDLDVDCIKSNAPVTKKNVPRRTSNDINLL